MYILSGFGAGKISLTPLSRFILDHSCVLEGTTVHIHVCGSLLFWDPFAHVWGGKCNSCKWGGSILFLYVHIIECWVLNKKRRVSIVMDKMLTLSFTILFFKKNQIVLYTTSFNNIKILREAKWKFFKSN